MVPASIRQRSVTASGENGATAAASSSIPVEVVGQRAEVDEVLVEQRVDHGRQQVRVGAGLDRRGARRPWPRSWCAGGRRRRPDRPARGSPRAGRGSRGRCTGCRWTRRGWRPSSSRWSVRSRSGTGMVAGLPNISPDDTCRGIWSRVLAEYRLRVRRLLMQRTQVEAAGDGVHVGVADVGGQGVVAVTLPHRQQSLPRRRRTPRPRSPPAARRPGGPAVFADGRGPRAGASASSPWGR